MQVLDSSIAARHYDVRSAGFDCLQQRVQRTKGTVWEHSADGACFQKRMVRRDNARYVAASRRQTDHQPRGIWSSICIR